jgi:hypothetical protein
MSPLKSKKAFAPDEAASSDTGSPLASDDTADLAVKVVERPSNKHAEAYDYAGSILNHPQLSHEEKQSLLWVLAQSPAFHGLIPSSVIDFHEMPQWVHCSSSR